MKKLFTLLFVLAATTSFVNAQLFSDDFESYTAGSFIAQSSTTWATWSGPNGGGADDATVSSANAHSGSNSLFLSSTVVGGGPDDVVLPFGQQYNTGTFTFSTWIYVTAGKNAYFNYQANTTIGEVWSMDINFADNGQVAFTSGGTPLLEVAYPQGQWFELIMSANLNNAAWSISIDGTTAGQFHSPQLSVASINFYPVQNSSYYIDDVSFDHTPAAATTLNAAVTWVTVESGLSMQIRQPSVRVRNLGTTPITAFDITIDYNGTMVSQSFSGVSYVPGSVNTAVLTATLTLGSGDMPATASISNVNGSLADDDMSDDAAFVLVKAVEPAVGKVVVAEEATGTWCSWCPRGAVFMDSMATKYEGYFAGIAVHNADPMADEVYDAGIAPHIAGYPSALVDRLPEIDPSELETDFLERIVVAPKVSIATGALWNAATRELKVSIKSTWQEAVNGGQYKLAIVLTEDSVTGTGSGWSQSNSYAGGSNGVMGGFELLPSPVPASMMNYNHVGRMIFPSWDGYGAYATSVNMGDEVINTATFTLPSGWDENQIHIIGMVIYTNGGATHIDNASHVSLDQAVTNGYTAGTEIPNTTSIAFSDPSAEISLYPNPANDITNVTLNLSKASEVILSLHSVDGRLLQTKNYGVLNGGVHLPVVSKNLASGVYLIDVIIDGQKHTLKFIKK